MLSNSDCNIYNSWLMFSFWFFWNFCFQFVSLGCFGFWGVPIISTLQLESRLSRRRLWWSFVQNHSLARRAMLPQKRAAARRKAFSWYGMSVLFYYTKAPKGQPFGAMELILLWLCPGRISRPILLRLCCCAMPANTRRRRCRNKWRFAAKA